MLFSADGYQVVVMPMISDKAKEQREQDIEARRVEAEPSGEVEAEPTTEPTEAEAKSKRSRSRKRDKVAVA